MYKRAIIGTLVFAIAGATLGYLAIRNRPPVTVDDKAVTTSGRAVTINVLANDKDPDGDPLAVTQVTTGKNGETKVLPNGMIEYRPQRMFFGGDEFAYTVDDGRGGEATAKVTVEVRLDPPRFLRRRESASLSEMMQQPPTNVYGSSINVFVYGPPNQIAEVAITGHADSLTCNQASGAVMGTLLRKRGSPDEFLIAGAGRLVGGAPLSPDMLDDPAIRAFRDASRALREAEISDADAGELQALKAKVDQAEVDPKVQVFIAAAVSQPALESLLREADRLANQSGLVRVHYLPARILELAKARVSKAVADKAATIVEFRDLLAAPQEAAVIMPMVSTRTGQPVEINVSASEFSKQGFSEAVKQHRDAVETAIIGNARSRADFAKIQLDDNASSQRNCHGYSPAQLEQIVEMNLSCNQDGCAKVTFGQKMTRKEYCEKQLPQNQRILEAWLREAEAILAQLASDQKTRSGRTLSEFTHATLIDSMLRDWALPVGDIQAAFDHWRVNRRAVAWEILTRELDQLGIDRRALSGENVVFLASISGDRLKIRPVMVVDLRRSVVVIDERVGATAVVDAWSERGDRQTPDPSPDWAPTLTSVSQAASAVQASLEREPAPTMTKLLSLWAAEFTRSDPNISTRVAKAKEVAQFENASGVANLVSTLDLARYDDWKKQVIPVLNAVLESRSISPETLLRTALSIAKRVTARDAAASSTETAAAWRFLAEAAEDPSAAAFAGLPRFKEIESHFRTSPSRIIYSLVQVRARQLDAIFIDAAINGRAWPKEASMIDRRYAAMRNTAQTLIDLEISATYVISTALKQRSLIMASYRALLEDAPNRAARWNQVSEYLKQANAMETVDDINAGLDDVVEKIRSQQQNSAGLDTIVRHQLANQLNRMATRLMAFVDIYDKYGIRYSPDHGRLSARVAFENGAYAEALRRYFSFEAPVALWLPNLTWRVLEDFKGVPDGLRAVVDVDELLVSVRRGGDWVDVVRIRGAKADALQQLGTALVEKISAAPGRFWLDGEPISDQILTVQIPLRSELAVVAQAIRPGPAMGSTTQGSGLWLPMLKAMVYACAPPAGDLVSLSGRCMSETNASARHDRVAAGGGTISVLDPETLKQVAQTKFAEP